MTFIAIFVIVLVGIISGLVINSIYNRRVYGIGTLEMRSLSWPAQQILKEYRGLPEASRPDGNMLSAVKALDVKHGVAEVTQHFKQRGYETGYHTWNCDHTKWHMDRHPCPFNDYRLIHLNIIAINDALKEQEHALAVAGIESGLQEAESLLEQLRTERELIDQVTKELV